MNSLILKVILKYIPGRSNHAASRDTYLYISCARLVGSGFTSQNKQKSSPSLSGCVMVTASWHARSTMKVFFSAILLISLRALPRWLNFEWAFGTCFHPLLLCLFALSPWKLQSFGDNPQMLGWAVFTMLAPLCVFHSNCLHCQDVTKQMSHEKEGGGIGNIKRQWLLQSIKAFLYISS